MGGDSKTIRLASATVVLFAGTWVVARVSEADTMGHGLAASPASVVIDAGDDSWGARRLA